MSVESSEQKSPLENNIDPLIPAEGQDQFKAAIEGTEGLIDVRTTHFTMTPDDSMEDAMKLLPLNPGERVIAQYTQPDDMEGFEPGDKTHDLEYVLIGKFPVEE